MKKGLIYCLICPINKTPKYVGQTTRTLSKRLKEHKYKIEESNTYKNNWLKKLRKKKCIDDLSIFKLGEYPIKKINEMEEYWITFFNIQNIKLTNTILKGGFGGYREYNVEANKRRSEKLKGIKRKPMSQKQKDQISEFWIGNKNRLNKPHTQETKDKISKTKKGTIPHNIKKIKQFTKDGEFIKEWESSAQAGRELKMSQGNISMVANNKRKSAGGFLWKWSK
jgi:group I intron endonuclease